MPIPTSILLKSSSTSLGKREIVSKVFVLASSPLASFFDLFDGDTLRPFASAFPLLSGDRPRKNDIFADLISALPLLSFARGKLSLAGGGDERCLNRSACSRSPFLGDPSRVPLVVVVVALPRCIVGFFGDPASIQGMLTSKVEAISEEVIGMMLLLMIVGGHPVAQANFSLRLSVVSLIDATAACCFFGSFRDSGKTYRAWSRVGDSVKNCNGEDSELPSCEFTLRLALFDGLVERSMQPARSRCTFE